MLAKLLGGADVSRGPGSSIGDLDTLERPRGHPGQRGGPIQTRSRDYGNELGEPLEHTVLVFRGDSRVHQISDRTLDHIVAVAEILELVGQAGFELGETSHHDLEGRDAARDRSPGSFEDFARQPTDGLDGHPSNGAAFADQPPQQV